MNTPRTTHKLLIITLLTAASAAFAAFYVAEWATSQFSDPHRSTAEGRQPAYWVAPMDPNYRRDQPGKSPMGMDLVPVYTEGGPSNTAGPGAIWISPAVVNNLGVRTATAELRSLQPTIITVGYVQYDEDQLSHVHPRVEGWVEKLYVKADGDRVEKGQPLYALYSPELVNAQEELVFALNRNNPRLIGAAENRLQALQIDAAIIDELRRSQQVRRSLTFYSPRSGIIDNLNIREGSFVRPGTTLVSVGTLDDVWVQAEIFESQAPLVQVGQPVTMTLDYLAGKQWPGAVDYVYPTLDPQTRTARVRLRFGNPQALLKPNMFAKVAIQTSADLDVLVIPKDAVIRLGDQNRVVLALGEGRFKSVAVTLGRIDGEFAEIRSGLSVGERVVTSAQFLLDSESSKTSDFKRMNHANMSDRAVDPRTMDHSTMDHSTMDHSTMDHSTMNHSTMHHSTMDHSTMNHSTMDHSTMDHSTMDHSTMDHSTMKNEQPKHHDMENGND